MTKSGPLDVLGSTVGGGYEELMACTEQVDLGGGTRVRILDLPTLIRLKEKLGRDRDRAVLPILRRTLQERERNRGS
jgi:predicted nucleotidyltransferase